MGSMSKQLPDERWGLFGVDLFRGWNNETRIIRHIYRGHKTSTKRGTVYN